LLNKKQNKLIKKKQIKKRIKRKKNVKWEVKCLYIKVSIPINLPHIDKSTHPKSPESNPPPLWTPSKIKNANKKIIQKKEGCK
jgi:hypothetical protein